MLDRLDRLVPMRWRGAAVLPAAALTVHQLRFQLAYGDEASRQLTRQGHAYFGVLVPVVALLVALCAGLFVARFLEARNTGQHGDAGDARLSFLPLWGSLATLLIAIYAGQELAEGVIVAGHPAGLTGVFGSGGLLAIPLSIALGGIVALLLRSARAAVNWAASRACVVATRPRRVEHSRRRPLASFAPPRLTPLASAAAGRAPPLGLPRF